MLRKVELTCSFFILQDYIGDDYVEICECYEEESEDGDIPNLSSDYDYNVETDDYIDGVDDDFVYGECCCEWVENPVSSTPTVAPTDPPSTPAPSSTRPTPFSTPGPTPTPPPTSSPSIRVSLGPTTRPTPTNAPSDDEADLVEGFLPRSNDV